MRAAVASTRVSLTVAAQDFANFKNIDTQTISPKSLAKVYVIAMEVSRSADLGKAKHGGNRLAVILFLRPFCVWRSLGQSCCDLSFSSPKSLLAPRVRRQKLFAGWFSHGALSGRRNAND